ncbi:AraC-like transcriptional regulator QhpR [Labrys monachus]|uniref:AraC-like DNA-binding protein n=1 Tax=Labrys monachus TaxID=217067 RepID=A0ABU0FFB6_9HYPH|nr:AraC family transcriptional regulator [Labrys monachus]MDQ0393296.1 AraC-like DNA-binding protein [Labrys monachus]
MSQPTSGADHLPAAATASNARILSSAANGISEFIVANGADPGVVLRAAGIDERIVRTDRGSLDLRRYCEMIELAARVTKNDDFGLQFGRDFSPERLGLIGEIVLASPTLGASLENLARFFPYHQQNTATAFRRSGGLWRLEFRILDGRILQGRHYAEMTMAMYLNVIRSCLGPAWTADEVHFEHPCPGGIATHRSVFNAPVYFSMATNALVFRDGQLATSMPGGNPARMRDLCQALTLLTGSTGTLSLTDQVTGEIRSRLPSGYPHIEDVAEALQMTRWTLQRRLADHGRVFSDLVETTRQRLAELHLGQAHMPIREIADILGYSELSAFSRACVRWFAAPPSRVREGLLRTQAP